MTDLVGKRLYVYGERKSFDGICRSIWYGPPNSNIQGAWIALLEVDGKLVSVELTRSDLSVFTAPRAAEK